MARLIAATAPAIAMPPDQNGWPGPGDRRLHSPRKNDSDRKAADLSQDGSTNGNHIFPFNVNDQCSVTDVTSWFKRCRLERSIAASTVQRACVGITPTYSRPRSRCAAGSHVGRLCGIIIPDLNRRGFTASFEGQRRCHGGIAARATSRSQALTPREIADIEAHSASEVCLSGIDRTAFVSEHQTFFTLAPVLPRSVRAAPEKHWLQARQAEFGAAAFRYAFFAEDAIKPA